MELGEQARKALIQLAADKKIYLRGDIINAVDDEGDDAFKAYLQEASVKYEKSHQDRIAEAEKLKAANQQLLEAQDKNSDLMKDLQAALTKAEDAKKTAESDLDVLQRKTQYELMGMIVKVSLGIILGVGVFTTILYIYSLHANKETTLIGNAWSNMFGILLTNSFSIIGTIMGIRYASQSAIGTQSAAQTTSK